MTRHRGVRAVLFAVSDIEQTVAFFAANAHSHKQIAYAMGISESLVGRHLRKAMLKLGVRSRTELVRFYAAVRPDAGRDPREVGTRAQPTLSPALLDVLHGVLGGLSNAGIAARRGTSVRTVANQVVSLLRGYGVASRVELAMAASGRRGR